MRRSLFNARAGAVLTIAAAIVGAHGADAQTRTSPRYEADVTWPKPLPNRWVMPATTGCFWQRDISTVGCSATCYAVSGRCRSPRADG